jgi:hypothetical protein
MKPTVPALIREEGVGRSAEGFCRLETMVMHEVRHLPGMRDVVSVPSSVCIPHMLHDADRELPSNCLLPICTATTRTIFC